MRKTKRKKKTNHLVMEVEEIHHEQGEGPLPIEAFPGSQLNTCHWATTIAFIREQKGEQDEHQDPRR